MYIVQATHDLYITLNLEILCYDGCHLRKYATNTNRSQLTETTKQLANLNIVIDKLHFSGHVDRWCQEHCNPHNISDLENVNFTTKKILIILTSCYFLLFIRLTQKFVSKRFHGCPGIQGLQGTWIGLIFCFIYYCICQICITEGEKVYHK